MSKKMLKKSLALGALMAFVITGQAWAEILTNVDVVASRDGYNKFPAKIMEAGIVNTDASYKLVNDCAPSGYNEYETGYTLDYQGEDGKLVFNGKVDVYQQSNSRKNTSGSATIYGVRNYWSSNKLEFNGSDTNVTVKSLGQNGSAINALGMYVGNIGSELIFWGASVDINVDGYNSEKKDDTYLNGTEYGSFTGLMADSKGIVKTLENNILTVNVNSYGKATAVGISSIAAEINTEGKVEINTMSTQGEASGLSVVTTAGNATETVYGSSLITMNGELDIDVSAGTKSYGIYAIDGSNQALDDILIELNDTVTITSKSNNNAYGIYSEGGAVNLTDDLTVNATGYNVARGIEAREGSSVTIGTDAKDNNVTINAVATNESASGDWVIGVFSRHDGSEVNIKGDNVTINATATGTNMASGILANTETTAGTAKLDIDANNIIITADATTDGNAAAITTMSGSETNIKGNLTATGDKAIYTRGNAKTVINESGADTVVLNGDIAYAKGYDTDTEVIDAQVIINLNNAESALNGSIYAQDLSGKENAELKAKVTSGTTLGLSNGATWNVTGESFVNNLKGDGGIITVNSLVADQVDVISNTSTNLTVNGTATVADEIANSTNTSDALQKLANTVVTTNTSNEKVAVANFVTTEEGMVAGAYSAQVEDGKVITESITQQVNTKSDAVSDAGMALKAHWRAHMNDMNKRMGDLRMANGETGVWTRMVRGESEYQGAKMQYNQYQLGYDEKLSVDKRWTVGAAVTFSEGDASYGYGSTDDKSTAFAIYGSKLNNDGTFVDLIARYAHLESDLDDNNYGTGDYSTNGMSVSAEFGKRIEQGNGLWIEPQVELTYGTVDSANVAFSNGYKAHYDSMDSFIARAGFALGKDIKQGNVYARASYLYDFDGETTTTFANGGKPVEEDFGGGWWEVGVGANINLSKVTYIYADVEKTFGGEVDTNWQWNLGVRYSF